MRRVSFFNFSLCLLLEDFKVIDSGFQSHLTPHTQSIRHLGNKPHTHKKGAWEHHQAPVTAQGHAIILNQSPRQRHITPQIIPIACQVVECLRKMRKKTLTQKRSPLSNGMPGFHQRLSCGGGGGGELLSISTVVKITC